VTVAPILKLALRYGAVLAGAVAVIAGLIGLLVVGVPGLLGGLAGAAVAAVFLGLTAGSILLAGKVSRGDGASPLFFGVVLGVWVLKLVVFGVALIVLRAQPWLDPRVFFGALVVVVLGSLIADMAAFARARVPYVSDVLLPGEGTSKPSG
jgi:hypothetical protein